MRNLFVKMGIEIGDLGGICREELGGFGVEGGDEGRRCRGKLGKLGDES